MKQKILSTAAVVPMKNGGDGEWLKVGEQNNAIVMAQSIQKLNFGHKIYIKF